MHVTVFVFFRLKMIYMYMALWNILKKLPNVTH